MLFAVNIVVEQEVIVDAITMAFFIFTRFWCTPTHVESKESSDLSPKTSTSEVDFCKLSRIQDMDPVVVQFLSN